MDSNINYWEIDNLPKKFTRPQIGCLGLAGPFHNGVFSITNLGWQIKEQEFGIRQGFQKDTLTL